MAPGQCAMPTLVSIMIIMNGGTFLGNQDEAVSAPAGVTVVTHW